MVTSTKCLDLTPFPHVTLYQVRRKGNQMTQFRITYRNNATGAVNSIVGSYKSLESAQREEAASMAMFQRINPALELVSIEVA